MQLNFIPPYYQGKTFRIDSKLTEGSIWIERIDDSGGYTEEYAEIDNVLLEILIKNNQIKYERTSS